VLRPGGDRAHGRRQQASASLVRLEDAELIGRAGLAFADALNLGGMEGIELQPRWRCCCERVCLAFVSGDSKTASRVGLACDLAADVADEPAEPRAQDAPAADDSA
jgi:hypothetical protein